MDTTNHSMYKSNMTLSAGPTGRLTINSAARFHCSSDWSWDTGPDGFADRDLWVVLAGEGELRVADASWSVSRGDTFVLPPRTHVIGRHTPSRPLTVVAVHFDGGGALPTHVRVLPVEFLAGTLDRLLRARLHGRDEEAGRWLEAAFDERSSATVKAFRPGTLVDLVREMSDRIRDRPGDDWNVAALAQEAGVSTQHLGRVFARVAGRSPRSFITQARIEAARALLRGTSLPLKRIAAELGFHDEFHLSRQFKRVAGRSPAAYRAGA